MARSRTPLAKAEISGAALKNPGRFRGRRAFQGCALGEPYTTMTEEQKAAWRELEADLPWLNSAHRQILRLACIYAARLNDGEELGVSAARMYSALLSKLGATPADAAKVSCADDDSESDHFFSRPN